MVETVDGDMACLDGRSCLQVTLGWEDCCGGDGVEDQPAFISERETPPQPVHPSNQIRTITFPSPQKPRRSVILMTLISVLHFSFFFFNFR